MLNLRQQIGSNLKKYRQQKKLTQAQLAVKVNFDRSVVSRLEKGSLKASFSIENLEACAIALEVKLEELICSTATKG